MLIAGSHHKTSDRGLFGSLLTFLVAVALFMPSGAVASTYNQQTFYPTSGSNNDIKTGDFTSDGYQDIAILSAGDNKVTIYANNGLGSFSEYSTVSITAPLSLDAADLDANGTTDLIVGDTNGGIHYFLNTNDGAFGSASGSVTASGNYIVDIETDDISGDGKADIVWLVIDTSSSTTELHTSINDGTGNFTTETTTALTFNSFGLSIGDYSVTGPAACPKDIAVNDSSGSQIVLFRSTVACNGTLSATTSSVALTGQAMQIVSADFSNDDKLDIAEPIVTTDSIEIIKNRIPASPSSVSSTLTDTDGVAPSSGVAYLDTGDINGDGNQDVVASNTFKNALALLYGAGDDTLSGLESVPLTDSSNRPYRVQAADFDGDGKSDIAVLVSPTTGFEVLLSTEEDPCVTDPASCETTETTTTTTTTPTVSTQVTSVPTETSPTTTSTTTTTTTTTTSAVEPLAVSLSLSKKLKLKALKIKVGSNRTASFKAAIKIKLGKKTVRLTSKQRTITAGGSYTFKFKATGIKKRKILNYLAAGRKPKISIKITATTTDGLSNETYSKTKKSKINKK